MNIITKCTFVLLALLANQAFESTSCDAQVYYRSSSPTVYRSYRPTYSVSPSSRVVYSPRVVYPTRSSAYSSSTYPSRSYSSYRRTYPSSAYRSSSRSSSTSRSRATRAPYRLDSGDVVSVLVYGVTGELTDAPVHMPEKNKDDIIPSVGHPMVVLPDGTLPLPLIDPVYVRGLTVTQARDKASRAYLDEEILKKDKQVTLSLTRKRTVNVSVLHDNPAFATRGVSNIKLPADRANVLNALVGAGPFDRDGKISVVGSGGQRGNSRSRLSDGDIVQVKSARAGFFYTGGNLQGGEFPLPTDRRINALQAISIAGGVRTQNFIGPREVIVIRRGGGSVRASYAQVLNNPNALLILPGDTVVLR